MAEFRIKFGISGLCAAPQLLSIATLGQWVYSDDTFGTNRNITRSEAVTIGNRMLGWETKMLTDNIQLEFSDLTDYKWHYNAVMLAANGVR